MRLCDGAQVRAMNILYGDGDAGVMASLTALLREAGYRVEQAVGRNAIEQAVAGVTFDLVILGHTLSKEDRHHLPYAIKKSSSTTRVMVLHASGHHPKVDLALDSRRGEAMVLQAVADLLCQPVGS